MVTSAGSDRLTAVCPDTISVLPMRTFAFLLALNVGTRLLRLAFSGTVTRIIFFPWMAATIPVELPLMPGFEELVN